MKISSSLRCSLQRHRNEAIRCFDNCEASDARQILGQGRPVFLHLAGNPVVIEHPLCPIRSLVRDTLKEMCGGCGQPLRERSSAVGAAGAIAERAIVAGAVWHPLRTAADPVVQIRT